MITFQVLERTAPMPVLPKRRPGRLRRIWSALRRFQLSMAFPALLFVLLLIYQPAREVGGDFYDFLLFEDGQIGLVIGDVTDKGVPAALVMTATRTMIRTAAQERASP